MKYEVLDYSYGNLRLLDEYRNIIVVDRENLKKLVNNPKLKIVHEKRQRYPHLVVDIN